MIVEAKHAGFDAVKFQYWIVPEFLADETPRASYQGTGDQRELLEALGLDQTELRGLRELSREIGIDFAVTPYGPSAADFVVDLQPSFVKVGSGDVANPYVLTVVAKSGLPLVLATGMCSDDEIREINTICGTSDVIFLHCISAYPTDLDTVDLLRMHRIGEITGRRVGFSDHTIGITAASAAVALGAVAIEKHVTYDVNAEGPDHRASLPLNESADWVLSLKKLATGVHAPEQNSAEAANRRVVRKALYAAKDLPAGHIITRDDFVALRPLLEGVPALEIDQLCGKVLNTSLNRRQILSPTDLS